jgi:hypothetical protein
MAESSSNSSKKRSLRAAAEAEEEDDFAAEFKRTKAAMTIVSAAAFEKDAENEHGGIGNNAVDTQFRTIVLYFAVLSVPSGLMAPVAFQNDYRTAVAVLNSSTTGVGTRARECFLIPFMGADEYSAYSSASPSPNIDDLSHFVRQGSMISNRCLFRIHSRAFIKRGDEKEGGACSSSSYSSFSKVQADNNGGRGLYTLQRMFDEGVEGFLHPLKNVGMVQSDIPFCLRNEGIRSMEMDLAMGFNDSSQSHKLLARRASIFENMCGSVYVPQYRMPLNEWHNLKHFQTSPAGSNNGCPPVSRQFVCSSCCRKADRRRSCLEDCSEVFSIHGNITLRRDSSGVAVSFKVNWS